MARLIAFVITFKRVARQTVYLYWISTLFYRLGWCACFRAACLYGRGGSGRPWPLSMDRFNNAAMVLDQLRERPGYPAFKYREARRWGCQAGMLAISHAAAAQPATTSQGGSFQAVSATSAMRASPKSGGPRIALVQIGS